MTKMNKGKVLRTVDVNKQSGEKSPSRKRARYESPNKEKYSDVLSNDSAEIDGCITKADEIIDVDKNEPTTSEVNNFSPTHKIEQGEEESRTAEIALLQASLSKDTLKKLSLGEWDDFLIKKEPPGTPALINCFDLLSDEVVLHIFQFLPKIDLPKIALVCRRWHRLSEDESLWARMDLARRTIPPGALAHILSRQVVLLRLAHSELKDPPFIPGTSKAEDRNFKARTLYMDLSLAETKPSTLSWIFSKCYRLKKVSLENAYLNDDVILNLCISKDLEVLNLAMVKGITLNAIDILTENCRSLKQLNLSWTFLSNSAVTHLCRNLPDTIDRINLAGCRKAITNEDVYQLVNNCPKIRELDLSDCTGLTGEAIDHIVSLECLNFLALSRCYLIPSKALLQLKQVPTLMFLDIHGGYIEPSELQLIQNTLGNKVTLNKFKFSSVARPTVGPKHEYIWNMRVKFS